MKHYFRTAVIPCLLFLPLCTPRVSTATDLYSNDFESETVGTITRPNDATVFEFHGDNAGIAFVEEITATDGVGGSQSYRQTIDSTAAQGDFYFYSGFGQFAVNDFDMPTGPGSNGPANYRFSADVKIFGANGSTPTTPLSFRVAAIDPDYETQFNVDVNEDGDMLDGAAVYVPVVTPTITTNGSYAHVTFTMDQGTQEVDEDVALEHRVFSNQLSLLWQVNYHQGGFGFDSGNMVSIDNVRIEFPGVGGDYNFNGVVDAADYTVWRDSLGGAGLPNEVLTLGTVDIQDYNYWADHFGEVVSLGASSGLFSAGGVPEPAAICLLLSAVIGCAVRRPGRRR